LLPTETIPKHPSSDELHVGDLLHRLHQIEAALNLLLNQHKVKDFYSTDEVAEIVDKAPFTVREWARLGRIKAEKRQCGRGTSREWMISKDELDRLQNEGLLPRK
jgi:Helix-turn-helix domain